jgi:hypothetical protein
MPAITVIDINIVETEVSRFIIIFILLLERDKYTSIIELKISRNESIVSATLIE